MGRLARRIRAHWRKRHRKREALRTSREFFKRQHTLRRWCLPKQNSSDITPFTGAPSSHTTPAPPKHGLLDSLLPSRKTTDARSTHTGTARRGALTVEASAPGASTHQPRLLDARTYENLRDFIDAKVLSSPHEPPSAPSCWLSCSSRSCSYCRSPQMTGKWRRCITHFLPPPAP